jgi:peptidoglycan hydrolase-like protein with peptidoglycan-binding domain
MHPFQDKDPFALLNQFAGGPIPNAKKKELKPDLLSGTPSEGHYQPLQEQEQAPPKVLKFFDLRIEPVPPSESTQSGEPTQPTSSYEYEQPIYLVASVTLESPPTSRQVLFDLKAMWPQQNGEEHVFLPSVTGNIDVERGTVRVQTSLWYHPNYSEEYNKPANEPRSNPLYYFTVSHPQAQEDVTSTPVDLHPALHRSRVGLLSFSGYFHPNGVLPCLDEKGELFNALFTLFMRQQKHPEESIAAIGHADSTGEHSINYDISLQRAQALTAFLNEDYQQWVQIAQQKGTVRDYQQIFKSLCTCRAHQGWSCDPGAVDGIDGPKTQTAVKQFQSDVRDIWQYSATVDGIVGPQTWRAIAICYCHELCHMLTHADPNHTAPEAKYMPQLAWLKFNAIQGYGESFPIEAVGQDHYDSKANRRVDILFAPGDWAYLKPPPNTQQAMSAQESIVYNPHKTLLQKLEWERPKLAQNKIPLPMVELPGEVFVANGRVPCLDENDYLLQALATALLYLPVAPKCYRTVQGSKLPEYLVVFGHGNSEDSFAVSLQQAQGVKCILSRDVKAWKALTAEYGTTQEYQTFLKTLTMRHGWNCDPGAVDGIDGPKTQGALQAFQQQANARYGLELAEDGIIGPQTWSAFHRVLCGLLAKAMGVEDPPACRNPNWPFPNYGVVQGQARYSPGEGCYGCGDSFPINKEHQEQPSHSAPAHYRSQSNQRVELMFLPRAAQPTVAGNIITQQDAPHCPPYDETKASEYIQKEFLDTQSLPWDDMQIGEDFWGFFQQNMPHTQDPQAFTELIQSVFGENMNAEICEKLRASIQAGTVPAPAFSIVKTMKPEQLGAYLECSIYLNHKLIIDANANPHSQWLLLITLVHETGHYLDDLLRKHYSNIGGDTPGDEGHAFAQAYIMQASGALLQNEICFVDIIYNYQTKTYIQKMYLTPQRLSSEAREQSFWGYRMALGEEMGSIVLEDGSSRDAELLSLGDLIDKLDENVIITIQVHTLIIMYPEATKDTIQIKKRLQYLEEIGYAGLGRDAYGKGIKQLKQSSFVKKLQEIYNLTKTTNNHPEFAFTGNENGVNETVIPGYQDETGQKSVKIDYLVTDTYGAHTHPTETAMSLNDNDERGDLYHSRLFNRDLYLINSKGDLFFTIPDLANIGIEARQTYYGQVYLGNIKHYLR